MIDVKKVWENLQTEIMNRFQWAFWWPFILSWCIVNWKIILVIFSWNSKEIDDKIKYIENLFSWDFSWFWLWLSLGKLFIFPLLGSLIAVWLIPYLTRWYLRKQIDNKNKENEEYQKWLKSEIEVKDKELELQEKIEKIEKNQEEWEQEFHSLIENEQINTLISNLRELIYEHKWDADYINALQVANLDAIGLIKFSWIQERKSGYKYALYEITEKWKFFIKLYNQAQ